VSYSNLSPPELFSICAQAGDPASWEEFLRRFNPVIARSVLRVARRHGVFDKSLVDDLVQDTYLKICASECRLLRTFTPETTESAFGFLKVVAANVAQDFFRSRLAEKRSPEATARSIDEVPYREVPGCPESSLSQSERGVLIDQIDGKLKGIVPPGELRRARTIFWLYYRVGLPASAIARLPTINLSTKGVESFILRLTRGLRHQLGLEKPDKQKTIDSPEGIGTENSL
jgi:RNA polymerase sigma-70 factor (ECF subfamily)